MSGTINTPKSSENTDFASNLFSVIVDKESSQNVIYSPASIHACLTLAFAGAEGQTAEEMRKVLKLPEGDKELSLENCKEFLKNFFESSNSTDDAPQLKMVNRLYVNDQLKVAAQFNKIAQDYLNTQAESVNFSKNQEVVKNINHWVEQQTENKIKNLLQTDAVNADTSAVIVNAIYFKAKWEIPFSKGFTTKSTFYVNKKQQVEVEMMSETDDFGYAELPELKSKALQMRYKNSDISMLMILPNDIEGLKTLERKLKNWNFNEILSKIVTSEVCVEIPKFRIEYDIDLKDRLKEMGLTSMFDETANFSGLFDTEQQQKISDVRHKAYLDVNEAGSEAAAASFVIAGFDCASMDQKEFRADHPFVFTICSDNVVYFAGHVVKF